MITPSEPLALENLEFLHLNKNFRQIKGNYNPNIYDIPLLQNSAKIVSVYCLKNTNHMYNKK